MLLVVGAFTLASCGGGGSPAAREAGTEIVARAPEVTITPPETHAPQAIGTIPALTLTAGGDPCEVDIARYFQDPGNDLLRCSAESSGPDIASVDVSGPTLAPGSAGEATVKVIASDSRLEATQTITVTVQELAQAPIEATQTENSPTPETSPQLQPQPQPQSEPETTLTGIGVKVTPSNDGQRADFRVKFVPEDAELTVLDIAVNPSGRIRHLTSFGNTRYFRFSCANGYHGVATISLSMQRTDVETSVQVTCR
ncbi:MAG: hypothetical protein OXH79_15995 [Boseongicola sp.]|nr:hypothetical protein [Boseongicola sp.]